MFYILLISQCKIIKRKILVMKNNTNFRMNGGAELWKRLNHYL